MGTEMNTKLIRDWGPMMLRFYDLYKKKSHELGGKDDWGSWILDHKAESVKFVYRLRVGA